MCAVNRRKFLRASGLVVLPSLIPFSSALAKGSAIDEKADRTIRLYGDGEDLSPIDYLAQLQKANAIKPILKDVYGSGGVTSELEKRFAQITGKEAAIYMPSGTMANQLAIAVLSGPKSKVFVQDTSHVYRDEADAAQTVHNKRLMPLAKNEAYFTVQELKSSLEGLPQQEYFQTGVGAVSIENPVRRAGGRYVPVEEMQQISTYCKSKGIKMHLDGARIFMASAWSGTSIKTYASYFDTVYISLYKYLGADGGAILCGDKDVIDQMPHLMKIHGGVMYSNWTHAAMALYKLEGYEERLKEARRKGIEIFKALNKMSGIEVTENQNGTNIYNLQLSAGIDGTKLKAKLLKDYNIGLAPVNDNKGRIMINETLNYQNPDYVIKAFERSI